MIQWRTATTGIIIVICHRQWDKWERLPSDLTATVRNVTFFRSQEAEIAAPNGQDDGRVVKSTGQEWIRYTSGTATTGGQTMER